MGICTDPGQISKSDFYSFVLWREKGDVLFSRDICQKQRTNKLDGKRKNGEGLERKGTSLFMTNFEDEKKF